MAVVGIDFGTFNCVISQAKRGGIEVALNEASGRQTAALVSFSGAQRAMGVSAVSLQSSNYKNTVVNVKRFIGRRWSDPEVQKDIARCPNKAAFVETEGDRIGITVHYDDEKLVLSPEVVCAMLIGSLRGTAEFANDGRRVADLVFSVPAYWGDRERRAFMAAAHIADVPILGLINDGTATALGYGIWKSASNQFSPDEAEHIMFVDMGYAATQVTVVAFFQGRLKVIASASDPSLGGRDMDWLLAQHFAKEFRDKHGADPLSHPKATLKLLSACEKAKQTLTPEGVKFANVNVEFLMNEIDFSTRLTIETFEELMAPLVDRLAAPVEQAMEMSQLGLSDLKAVEIVGGATRVRCVKKRLGEVLELDASKLNFGLSTTLNADEACARGCALRSAMLSPAYRVKEFHVIDVVTRHVTVSWDAADLSAATGGAEDAEDEALAGWEKGETAAGRNEITLLQPGDEAGAPKRIKYRRTAPFEVRASYGESSEGGEPLGQFKISGMPAHESSEDNVLPRIRVDFVQDDSGMFGVKAADYLQLLPSKEATPPPAPAAADGDAEAAGDGEGKNGDGAKPMEVDAGEGKNDEAKKPVTREFKAVPLKVFATYDGALTADEVESARLREQEFAAHDRVLRETGEAKNALESYVYSMRDKLSGELREFATEDEREAASKALERDEAWIYDEGYDEKKHVYEERLLQLKQQCAPFVRRQEEREALPEAEAQLRAALGRQLAVVNSPDDKYKHITDDERDEVRAKCEAAEKWLAERSAEQAERKTFQDVAVTPEEVRARASELERECSPIVNKPKPKPKKKKDESKQAEAAAGGDSGEGKSAAEGKAADADAEAGAGEGKDGDDDAAPAEGEGKTEGDSGMDVD